MTTTEAFDGLVCTDCDETFGVDTHGQCPACGGVVTPRYDLDEETVVQGLVDPDAVPLPFTREVRVTASEGATPLVAAGRLADEMGVASLSIKDEGRNPTGTVYDRGMSLAVTAADRDGTEPLALAAAGNAGQSAAAYAGRIDARSYAFVPSRTAFSNKALVNVHGGEMRVVGGRFDDAAAAVDEQLATDYHSLSAFETAYRHDGTKSLVYEVVVEDALARGDLSARTASAVAEALPLSPPDALVVPVGTGELVVAVARGLDELTSTGVLADPPTVHPVQPAGCAPIVSAHSASAETTEPWETPDTIVGELEIPDPAGGDLALDALAAVGGEGVTVSDDDALESAVTVAQTEVLEVGGAGGVALAGAWDLAESGELDGDDRVVVVNTDAGVKTPDVLRSHLMGKGI